MRKGNNHMKTQDYCKSLGLKPLEIEVRNDNFEDAVRRFKTLVQAEGVIAAYKSRQAYEKPSERKRRKSREAQERAALQALREAQIISGEWEKRQKRKEAKRLAKQEKRQETTTND